MNKVKIQLKALLLFHMVLCLMPGLAQSVSVNYDIDTSVFEVSEPLTLWLDFLNTKDDAEGAKYWNRKEVEKYGGDAYFLVEHELQFGDDNYLKLLGSYGEVEVLSVRKKQTFYKITSLLRFKPRNGKSNIQYIFHVYAGIENNQLKLFNALEINTDLYLESSTVGYINFHYPKMHPFNIALAEEQNSFLIEFSKLFEIPIVSIDYYFADSNENLQKIKGFDFLAGDNGEHIPSGKADIRNRIVYASGLGEYYPHEFIHILIDPHFPDCHLWINEGLATYFGMSRGKDLDWHLKRINAHLSNHPEINLSNMLDLRSLDQYTDYRYALGGFIIRKAFEKGGSVLVKKMMTSGKSETDFYQAIEDHLGLKREEINNWIREDLNTTYNQD